MPSATIFVQEAASPAGTASQSVLTLINSAVGAGVLSFPFALRCTGWAAGLACIAAIAATEAFTLFVLAKLAEHTGAKSYAALVHQMLGAAGSMLMASVIFLYCFGSCIAYLIITGDSFRPLLLEAFGTVWWTSRTAVIVGVGCGAILPLSFKTRLGGLKAVSSLCFFGLMSVTVVIVLRAAQIVGGPGYSGAAVRAVNHSLSFLAALPIMVFGFHCHTNVISVWEELEPRPSFFRPASDPALDAPPEQPRAASAGGAEPVTWQRLANGQRRPKSEKLEGMARVVAAAVGVTALFYSCVGLAGYLAFPDSVKSNVTLNFPEDDLLIQVARAMVGLIQVAAYPVNHFPARGAVRDVIQLAAGRSPAGAGFVATETLAFFGSTLAIALACDDLGDILRLVGGVCGSVLILAMPGALLVQYARSKQAKARQVAAEALREPLLPSAEAREAGAVSGGALNGARELPLQPYSVWRSKLFHTGLVLLALSAALTTLTVWTTVRPLAPP